MLIGGFYGLALWVLFHRWRTGRSAPQFVAGLFPTALLFVTVPIPLGGWTLIQGFRQIATQGFGGVREVAMFCLAIARDSLLATVAFLMAVLVTVALQFVAAAADRQSPKHDGTPDSGRGTWRRVVLAASTLLIVPIGVLGCVAQGTLRLVMHAAALAPMAAETGRGTSETVARQALLAVSAGGILTALVGFSAMMNFVAVWSGTASESLRRYFWAVLVMVSVLAVWDVAQLMVDVNAFQSALR